MNKNILSPFYFALFLGLFLFSLCFLGARPALAYVKINSTGQIFGKWTERSFGQRLPIQEFSTPYGFTGREFEESLGLSFHRARFYDPGIGRFISMDPVFGDIGNPMTQHSYVYGNLNPYRFVDPMGEAAETPWDLFNVGLGIASIKNWNDETSLANRALDIFGLSVDIVATAVPFVPGGAGVVLRSMRATNILAGLNRADVVLTGISGTYSSGSSMAEEGVGFGNSAQMALSVAGILPKASKNMRIVEETRATSIHFRINKKISKQMSKRGWTLELIENTVQNSHTARTAINKSTGVKATAYFRADGNYVVRDNITGDILQISNRNDPSWIPDSTIQNPFKLVK